MISYAPFWETLKKRGVSQYKLIRTYRISAGQINRLKKNMYISTGTIDKMCHILDCQVEDIIKYTPDEAMGQEIERIRE